MSTSVANNLARIWQMSGLSAPTEEHLNSVAGSQSEMPWYVRLFAAAGALLASSLLLAFLFISEAVNTPTGSMVVGLLLLGGGCFASFARPSTPLGESVLPALLIPGQILVYTGFGRLSESIQSVGAFGVVLSAALLLLCRNQLQRFLSGLGIFAFGALLSATGELKESIYFWTILAGLCLPLFYALQSRWNHLPGAFDFSGPVGAALSLALLGLNVASSFTGGVVLRHRWLPAVAMLIILLAMLYYSFHVRLQCRPTTTLGICLAVGIVLAPTYMNSGISGALLVVLVGFAYRVRLIAVLGLLSLVGFVSLYYYSLELTLLQKSLALMGSGGLLLVGSLVLHLLPRRVQQ